MKRENILCCFSFAPKPKMSRERGIKYHMKTGTPAELKCVTVLSD